MRLRDELKTTRRERSSPRGRFESRISLLTDYTTLLSLILPFSHGEMTIETKNARRKEKKRKKENGRASARPADPFTARRAVPSTFKSTGLVLNPDRRYVFGTWRNRRVAGQVDCQQVGSPSGLFTAFVSSRTERCAR